MERNDTAGTTPVGDTSDAAREQVPDDQSASIDAAQSSRHLFTLTVEDVASLLHIHGLDRDARTIQRWCKSGKVRAVLDDERGERWLMDPVSVEQMIGSIQKEMSCRDAHVGPTPRPNRTPVAARRGVSVEETSDPKSDRFSPGDPRRDNSATLPEQSSMSGEGRDADAATSRRVHELEVENALLRADKEARDQMVGYLKEQFEGMIKEALDRTQRLGQVEAENDYLRKALPPSRQNKISFHPRNVQHEDTALRDDFGISHVY